MDLPEDTRAGLLANVAPGDNSPALTVSELSGALKRTVEGAFAHVRVRGEISGFKRHGSGHCYFTLKDENACIDAVIWRSNAGALAFLPEDGAEVIATGKLTTYPGRSKYQIVVERMEIAGEGALLALLEKRRKALAAEGLFDADRKRKLPFFPRVIGVVTSPTGAVIRDILHRLEDRCPTRVILWPVPVQGEGASTKIAAAIRAFPSRRARPRRG
jgi:exodeoxyribonuclease VII large subunit